MGNPPVNTRQATSGMPWEYWFPGDEDAGWHFNDGGLWGRVWLVIEPEIYFRDPCVHPNLSADRLEVSWRRWKNGGGRSGGFVGEIASGRILSPSSEALLLGCDTNDGQRCLPLECGTRWSPDCPALYELEGEVGAFSMPRWTRLAKCFWAAGLYRLRAIVPFQPEPALSVGGGPVGATVSPQPFGLRAIGHSSRRSAPPPPPQHRPDSF